MCDELTDADNERFLGEGLSRRAFGVAGAAAGIAMMLPAPANALAVKGRDVEIRTPDGTADAYFVAPGQGSHPAVLVWPDIMGLRPAFRQMGERLAQSGYAVLTVNPFYRSAKPPYTAPGEDPAKVRDRAFEYRKLLTPEATLRDAAAFIGFLDRQKQVDRKRGIGTTGYCMGGPMVMLTAAGTPARVRAGATFHGGGMATDEMLARVPGMKASYLVAVAENDDARAPEEKDKLRAAFAAAKLPAEIEVYPGTLHGWCPPDSPVYNQAQAERAWSRMLHLFKTAL